MSVHASSWAWRQQVGDKAAKLVLLKLADQANDNFEAWPSRQTLATECELDVQGVKRRLRLLRDGGWIAIEPRHTTTGRQTSNLYRLLVREGVTTDPLPRVTTDPPEGVTTDPLVSLNRQKDPKPTSDDVGARPIDELWESLVDAFGPVVDKTQAHGKRNKAVGDLRKLGATAESIDAALKAWPRLFDGAAVTDVALATHYPQLLKAAGWKDGQPTRRRACVECGVGGGLHAAGCSLIEAPAA